MLIAGNACIWSIMWDIYTGSFPIVNFSCKKKQKQVRVFSGLYKKYKFYMLCIYLVYTRNGEHFPYVFSSRFLFWIDSYSSSWAEQFSVIASRALSLQSTLFKIYVLRCTLSVRNTDIRWRTPYIYSINYMV